MYIKIEYIFMPVRERVIKIKRIKIQFYLLYI